MKACRLVFIVWLIHASARGIFGTHRQSDSTLEQVLDQMKQLRDDVHHLTYKSFGPLKEQSTVLAGEIQAVLDRHRASERQCTSSTFAKGGQALKYRTAAVSCDAAVCSTIGRRVLLDGGNAVDASIASLFCLGVINPHSGGLGGGFLMTIADPKFKDVSCLDARETAPLAASQGMFDGNASLSQKGPLAVAVPGELAGYWTAHRQYGRLPWSRLVLPAAMLAERGVKVSKSLATVLRIFADDVKNEPSMRKIFVDEGTGQVLVEGDTFKMPRLAATLRTIAQSGVDVFYNGTVGQQLVEDVQRAGGILTADDLLQYRPLWVDPVRVDLKGDMALYSSPPPGSGVLVAAIMKVLDGLSLESLDRDDPTSYHLITEALKHAYGQRTKLGDPRFVPQVNELVKQLTSDEWVNETIAMIRQDYASNDPELYGAVTYQPDDHGTAHVSVLDSDGMAVAATTTINLYFGARFISEQTGIILNDEMDDFSSPGVINFFGVPPSPANFIQPGKRPLSSMAPIIVMDTAKEQVRLVVGSVGGTRIISSLAYTLARHLWLNETMEEAVKSRRIHHQLLPMVLFHEPEFPQGILADLKDKGHQVEESDGRAAVFGLSIGTDGLIHAVADDRKSSGVDGVDPID